MKSDISKTKRKARTKSLWERHWDGAIKKQPLKKAMKPSIWSTTPPDIQLLLLKFLPITSLCRFRCISRSWRSAIATTTPCSMSSSNNFISLHDELRIRSGSSWRNFNFPVTPKEARVAFQVSTSAGLVLTTHGDCPTRCWLTVHNPFVQSSAAILGPLPRSPESAASKVVFTGIQALPSSITRDGKVSFTVVCLVFGEQLLVHVFDSRTWTWVVEAAPVPGLGTLTDSEVVFHGVSNENSFLLRGDLVYFLTASRRNTRSLKSISISDPEHSCKTVATWKHLPLNLHQNPFKKYFSLNHPSIISCQGKNLLLVNVVPSPPYGAIGFVFLDEETGRWQELLKFPMDGFPERVRLANVKAELRIPMWAWGSPDSSKVSMFFPNSTWGCIFDVADSTWRAAFFTKAEVFMHFRPSFLTF